MAHYHVSVKVAKKEGDGRMRASAHYAYIGRIGAFEKLRSSEELIKIESGNMPSWAKDDPSIFWLASDKFERENGTVYREIEAALPRELSFTQQLKIISDFCAQVLENHPYTSAIHIKNASDGKPQPHVHLMWSERKLDGIERDPSQLFKRVAAARQCKDGTIRNQPDPAAGGCRKISMQPRLEEFRKLWAALINDAYDNAGSEIRVSHLSLIAQGISRDPERHLGPIRMQSEEGKMLLRRRKAIETAEEEEANALTVTKKIAKMRPRQDLFQDLFKSRHITQALTENRIESPIITLNPGSLPSTIFLPTTAKAHSQKHDLMSAPQLKRQPKPRAYSSEVYYAKAWRSKALIKQYGITSELIAAYWRMHSLVNRREVIYEQKNGENRVVDKGALITAKNGNQSEINLMIELAKMKRWSAIIFTGSDEFKFTAMKEALRAGLKVTAATSQDEKLLVQASMSVQRTAGSDAKLKINRPTL